jgi:glycosyltransferase involved in cell wall biosynthesis
VRVRFLIRELGLAGGQQTIASYARALAARGWDVALVATDPRVPPAVADVDGVPVVTLADAAGAGEVDCVIAGWWTTAASLWEIPARRRVVFLQSLESRFYEERDFFERFAAEEVLALPAGYVVVAGWMRDVLAQLRPDAPCDVVLNGIDKQTFAPREHWHRRGRGQHRRSPRDGPLRVLVEGQPSAWFKGVHEALAAVQAMHEPARPTVVAGDPATAGDLGDVRVEGGLDPAGMAALYAEHDVLLKLSRVEGLPLPPIEAFHVGLPAVVAPYTGHEEYIEHGRNGVVVGYDDQPGTARALDALARDRERLRALSEGALATAREWPSAESAADAFAGALERLASAPAPDPDGALRALRRAQRRWLELTREHVRQREAELQAVRGAVRWHEDALDQARAHVDELNVALRDAEVHIVTANRRVEEIRATRAYRAAVVARRMIGRGDRS